MPTNLATIASRNLATEDASLAKVNAAQRLNTLPGVGAPYSTPATDVTNLSTAAAMDRADLGGRFGFGSPQYQQGTETPAPTLADTHTDDIMARRAQIDGQKKEIMAKLGIIPPSEAGFSAVVLADPKERKRLLEDWHVLETQSHSLLQEHQFNAVDAARTAHEKFARESHIEASNDFAGLANDLLQIKKNPDLVEGTPEFHNAVIEAAQKHPLGSKIQAGTLLLRGISDDHDKAAGLRARAQIPTAGVEARYAHLIGNIQMHEDAAQTEAQANIKAEKANVPYTKSAQYHADQAELSQLTKRYPSLSGESVAPATPAKASVAPTAGEVRSGYKFKGGNPADKDNWEKVK
jgi:hypothetical protein